MKVIQIALCFLLASIFIIELYANRISANAIEDDEIFYQQRIRKLNRAEMRIKRGATSQLDFHKNCSTNRDCKFQLGLICSQEKVCECASPYFWSEYDHRCAICRKDWSYINNYCTSSFIRTNGSKDAYFICRTFDAYQINLLELNDYNTYVNLNIAPFPGIYIDLFYNSTQKIFIWGYGEILPFNSTLWCPKNIFGKYECAIFRTGEGYNCLFTGKCYADYGTICIANPFLYVNPTTTTTTTTKRTTPSILPTFGFKCKSNDDCDQEIGLTCQNGICICTSPWFPSNLYGRCISCNPGWSFVNDNCLSPVIFLRNASQDACLPYNAVQISVLLQDDFDTYVNMNIAPYGVYVDSFYDWKSSKFIWGYNRVLSNDSSMWCPNMQIFNYKCAALKTGPGYNCLFTARCKTDYRTICTMDPMFFQLNFNY